jgi:hypothetical protein
MYKAGCLDKKLLEFIVPLGHVAADSLIHRTSHVHDAETMCEA